MFCSLKYNAPKLLSACSLDLGTCLCGRCGGCCSSNILHIWVHYTSNCKTQSTAPEDGQIICPKLVELIETVNETVILASSWYSILFISMMQGQANIKYSQIF